jgi:type I restriction enzyme M protein
MTIRVSKTSDPLGRYYTHAAVASLLVQTMGKRSPGLVLDLGAGDGALVRQASTVWKKTQFITVDIDENAGSVELPASGGSKFKHYVADALSRNLSEQLAVNLGAADAAVCNPPYIRPRWKKHFGEILEEAGLSHVLPRMSDAPSDLLFIAQNLRFLRSGGHLGLILPDGIIAGERFQAFRETLVRKHKIERVIELPRRIFKGTDAKAHIVVLAKDSGGSSRIEIQRVENDGVLSSSIALPSDFAKLRLDYSHYVTKVGSEEESLAIRDVALMAARGNCSSAQRRGMSVPVFHTTEFDASGTVPSNFALKKRDTSVATGLVAVPGDILIARVGRNLEDKVCIVRKGYVILSDCIFALRVQPAYRELVFSFLMSRSGRDALASASHGVAARFITTEALLNIRIST